MDLLPNPNGVKIYNVSVGKSLPEWLKDKKRKSLRYDQEYRRRLELIQDFDFPTASQCIKLSPNGEYLIAAGTYKPRIRVFDLAHLGLKFERHLDCEIVSFEILSEDFTKLVMLRADRTLDFHSSTGNYYQLRIPRAGRATMFDRERCELWTGGASADLWRLNLEVGQFMPPITSSLDGVTSFAQNKLHRLVAVGGTCPRFDCIDPRSRRIIGSPDISTALQGQLWDMDGPLEVTSLAYADDGLTMAVGSSSGHTLLYDLRAPEPLLIKDNQYGSPIKNLEFLPDKKVMSADSKIIKVWDRSTAEGNVYCSMEPPASVNAVQVVPNSGLFLVAPEQPKMLAYFVPSLGPAPRWCSFLDNLTEELEEDKQSLYDDFKFVTKEDLEKFALTKLVGTEYLKPYMHGYFIDMKLYNKLRAIARPFEWEEYKQSRIQEKIREEEESRISVKRKLPKVNARAAARILSEDKKKKDAPTVLTDDRFKDMWEKEEFKIDEEDEKYKIYHRLDRRAPAPRIEEHFEEVDNIEDEDDEDSDDLESSEDEEQPTKEKKKVNFYEIKTGHTLKMAATSAKEKKMSFSKRVEKGLHVQERKKKAENVVGNLELEFTPRQEERKERRDTQRRSAYAEKLKLKRGVGELRLPQLRLPGKSYRKRR